MSLESCIDCPICLSHFVKPTITVPCVHRFCEKCIKEVINLRAICPICNGGIQNTLRDRHFDAVVDAFLKADEAETLKLLTAEPEAPKPTDIFFLVIEEMNPVLKEQQRVFIREYREASRILDAQIAVHQNSVKILHKDSLTNDGEGQRQLKLIQSQKDEAVLKLINHMQSHLEKASSSNAQIIIPTSVMISFIFGNVKIESFDSLIPQFWTGNDVLDLIKQKIKPLELQIGEAYLVIKDSKNSEKSSFISPLNNKLPALAWGNAIELVGFKLISDDSKSLSCIAESFEKGKVVDYFSCKECNIQWICSGCKSCHSEHTLEPFILQFRPTWACCYCRKNKKCSSK